MSHIWPKCALRWWWFRHVIYHWESNKIDWFLWDNKRRVLIHNNDPHWLRWKWIEFRFKRTDSNKSRFWASSISFPSWHFQSPTRRKWGHSGRWLFEYILGQLLLRWRLYQSNCRDWVHRRSQFLEFGFDWVIPVRILDHVSSCLLYTFDGFGWHRCILYFQSWSGLWSKNWLRCRCKWL